MATKKKKAKKKIKELKGKSPSAKEILAGMNTTIAKHIKVGVTNFASSWNSIIPVVNACIKKVGKTKFGTTKPALHCIKILAQKENLNSALINAMKANDVNILHKAVYNHVLWFNDKNK